MLLQRNAAEVRLEPQASALLQSLLEESPDRLLVRDHSRDDRLLLLGTEDLQFRGYHVLVLVEVADGLDMRRVYVFQQLAVFMDGQDMVVEPLPFDEDHLQLFSLSLVQPLLDDLALVDFADLVLPFQAGGEQSLPYGSLFAR